MYVKKDINYIKREDLSINCNENGCEFETLFIEIYNKNLKNMIIGVVYRHPKSNLAPYLEKMESILATCDKEKKESVIMGDLNINFLSAKNDTFLNILLSRFYQLHNIQPTRFSENDGHSLIDNIFFNRLEYVCTSGNLLSHISDHLPNFLIICKKQDRKSKNKVYKRDYKNFDQKAFLADLTNCNMVDSLEGLLIDKHAPLKSISNKKMKQRRKPWINDFILKLIGKKNTLYSHFIQTGDREILKQYRSIRNDINHKIRKAKYQYYKDHFTSCKNNIRKFWKEVNQIINCKQVKDESPNVIISNGKTYNNPTDITEQLNSYFVNVAPSLIKKLPKQTTKRDFTSYLENQIGTSFYIAPVTKCEVEDLLGSFNGKKASDIYNFPINVIKDIKTIISEPLIIIINKSFSTGIFPDKLKLAKITPLY
ncbi:uncharacterized protein LOC130624171 [Hydractinia symbiolongicarpus]|uniref:uncharacterized protein LOC130624171 n=1 Tax=Hydractinia symbiolongicarpus TaxID=13093 RepID=UPI00254BEEFE|nr:uncharacterized protein LOC130624171 [Hydractinia symbiolongicarpus]